MNKRLLCKHWRVVKVLCEAVCPCDTNSCFNARFKRSSARSKIAAKTDTHQTNMVRVDIGAGLQIVDYIANGNFIIMAQRMLELALTLPRPINSNDCHTSTQEVISIGMQL